jgi:hypothetical protein
VKNSFLKINIQSDIILNFVGERLLQEERGRNGDGGEVVVCKSGV